MKANYVQEGNSLNYINPTETEIEAGTVIVFGVVCGVAATNIPSGELGSIAVSGAWTVPKDASDIKGGDAVYYDDSEDKATTTKKDTVLGYAIAAAGADATSVTVKLNGCPVIPAGE